MVSSSRSSLNFSLRSRGEFLARTDIFSRDLEATCAASQNKTEDFRTIQGQTSETSAKFVFYWPESSAQLSMAKKKAKTPLTAFKNSRGRKPILLPEEVLEHAEFMLKVVASLKDEIVWDKLQAARTEAEAESAIIRVPPFYREILKDRFAAILTWVREGKFPRKNLKRKMHHFADSIAGDVFMSPRRSRDICSEERKRVQNATMLLCREFYIECTCGYRGPAKQRGCRRCGTQKLSPSLQWDLLADQVSTRDPLPRSIVPKPRPRRAWPPT
jgi:hypothetical protein